LEGVAVTPALLGFVFVSRRLEAVEDLLQVHGLQEAHVVVVMERPYRNSRQLADLAN